MSALELYSLGVAPLLAAVSVFFVGLGVILLRNRQPPGVVPLGLALFAAAVWVGGAAAELLSVESITLLVLMRDLKYVGVCLLPPLLLLFVLRHALGLRPGGAATMLLFVVPVVSIAMVWTNPAHELMWPHPPPHPLAGTPRPPWGPWFVGVHLPVMYGMAAVAWGLLAVEFVRGHTLRRAQAAVLLLGMSVPMAVNVIYVLNPRVPDLQFTSLSFGLTAAIWGWGFFRFRLFKVNPLALRAVFDAVGDAVLLVDSDDRVADANPAALRLLGAPGPREVTGRRVAPALEAAGIGPDLPEPGAAAETVTEDGRHLEIEVQAIRSDAEGSIRGRVVVLRDATDRRRAEQSLRESEAMMRTLIERTPIGIVRLRPARDDTGRIRDFECLMANPTARRTLASGGAALIGRMLTDIRPPHTPLFIDTFRHVARSREPAEFVVQVDSGPEDGTRWFRLNAVAIAGDVSVTFLDVTAERSRQAAMEAMANQDALTGLLNRRGLEDDARVLLESAERDERSIGVLFMDLDGFKAVNDRHGHHAGDVMLQTFAARVLDCVRAEDLVGRVGGDEFVALVQEGQEDRILEMVARIRAVGSEPYTVGSERVRCSPSIGVAVAPRDGRTWQELLGAADAAMYRMKGRRAAD